ncbi:copper resistance protein NlpE N-terminal domain-containing protein [Flavobacterium phragmitis]|uniref:NlpE N-terminal domain-containing protein n=1 Tax=Flavobacterium phragmitis TaxID=739143 RepID=A0A1I1TUN1_9FLAO|nr:copper resistance protein NlpE N-terminal domain-containing protein [Flavobacterium phragmitis]SFD62292.1 NlpE N-terminal domain-containing protein [Flavobacterium phragmitis]
MKLILTVLLLIFNLITSFAQSNSFAGDYTRSLSDTEKKHIIEYKLTLNQDGTFEFHSYSKMQGGIPPENNKYGKGKWSSKDNLITFSSDKKEDLNEKYTLDFNNSTARFVTKNPRDKSDKVVQTKLQFLESGIFWMKRIDVFKI